MLLAMRNGNHSSYLSTLKDYTLPPEKVICTHIWHQNDRKGCPQKAIRTKNERFKAAEKPIRVVTTTLFARRRLLSTSSY